MTTRTLVTFIVAATLVASLTGCATHRYVEMETQCKEWHAGNTDKMHECLKHIQMLKVEDSRKREQSARAALAITGAVLAAGAVAYANRPQPAPVVYVNPPMPMPVAPGSRHLNINVRHYR